MTLVRADASKATELHTNGTADFSQATRDFWDAVATVVRRVGATAVEEMRARYELGQLVARLRRERPTVIASLAKRLRTSFGLTRRILHRYARVTEAILPSEFDGHMARRGRRGETLTWSHIEELAEAWSPDLRARYADEVFSENLSVRALRDRVRNLIRE